MARQPRFCRRLGWSLAALLVALAAGAAGTAFGRELPQTVWMHEFGSAGDDVALEIMRHSTGVYVIGRTTDALPGQTQVGGHDVYLRKLDFDGNEVWTRQFGTTARDSNMGLYVDDTGVYTAGGTRGAFPGYTSAGFVDVFVRKYDFDGNGVWTRQFGTAGFDSAHGILAHRVGPDDVRVYVVGGAGPLSGQTYAGGSTDAFLRLYDGDGNEVWTRQFGSSAGDLAWDVSLQRGRLYLAGDAGAACPSTIPVFTRARWFASVLGCFCTARSGSCSSARSSSRRSLA